VRLGLPFQVGGDWHRTATISTEHGRVVVARSGYK
jgi:hypothetical protein